MRYQKVLVAGLWVALCLAAVPLFAQAAEEGQNGLPITAPPEIAAQLDAMRAQIAANGWQFTVGYNKAMDYNLADLCGVKHYPPTVDMEDHFAGGFYNPTPLQVMPEATLPSRYVGWSSTIKDQGQCGSCWAFSMAGNLEAAYLMESGAPQVTASTTSVTVSGSSPDLSEQHIVSCNNMGYGCNGGNVDAYSEFMPNSGYYNGVVTEACFPYASSSGTAPSCHLCSSPTYTPVVSWGYLTNDSTDNTVADIKTAIYTYGSVTAYIYADSLFQAYTGGVFTDTASGTTNHAIVLVGWDDTLGSSGAWLLKNSWGSNTGWGIHGWMWISYGSAHVGQGAAWATSNGSATTYSISGTVSGAVASGVTVTLSGAQSATTSTASDGTYTFSVLANGSYTVTPSLTGYTFSPTSTAVTINGANQTGINFTSTAVPTYSISGTVSGAVASGVTITLSGAKSGSTTTGSGGTYSFSGLANGSYTVTPSLSGYTFAPTSTAVTVSGANQSGINFTSTQNSGPTTLFSNGFDSSTGWAQVDTSGTAGTWSLVTSGTYPTCSVHGGSSMAKFNSYNAPSGSATRYYRTSGFAVASSYSTVTLTFWMYHDTGYSSSADKVQAQVSTNGSTWTNVGTAVNRYTGSTGWSQVTVNLSSYKGQTVYLGFLGTSAYGNNIYLDDVLVTGSGAASPDFAISASPTTVSAKQGNSGTTTVTTTVSGGFSSAIALSASGLPTGATATFSPSSIAAPGSGTSTLTLTAGASTAVGTYTVTITGTGGGKMHTATVSFSVTSGSGPVTLFRNGFESGTGWAQVDTSGTAGTWSLVTSGTYPTCSVHGGSYMARFNSYSAANGSATRYYQTSGFAVASTYSTVTLTFWMYHDTGYSSSADKVQAQVSTNGSTWANVGTAVNRYTGSTGWSQVTVNLSSYKGQTVYLGFLGTSAYGNNIYLDDVLVTAQ